jgi:CheY-like chemotaxis protein
VDIEATRSTCATASNRRARPARRRAAEKGLELAYVFGPECRARSSGDVTRLRQILLNLLSNAVKFTERGEVVLTCAGTRVATAGEVTHSPCATPASASRGPHGPAVPVVQPGRRSTTRKYGGTGLGLAISKRLAELMGGTMWAESRWAGQGGPSASPSGAAPASRRPPSAPIRHPAARSAGKRVLVVDDNATNRRILALQTGKWGMVAGRPRRPRRRCAGWRRAAFDLAILDMHMPGMDGDALARASATPATRPAAGAVQFARPQGGRGGPVRGHAFSPSRCGRASCSTRWSRLLRCRPTAPQVGAEAQAPDRPGMAAATRCASCWPRTTW